MSERQILHSSLRKVAALIEWYPRLLERAAAGSLFGSFGEDSKSPEQPRSNPHRRGSLSGDRPVDTSAVQQGGHVTQFNVPDDIMERAGL